MVVHNLYSVSVRVEMTCTAVGALVLFLIEYSTVKYKEMNNEDYYHYHDLYDQIIQVNVFLIAVMNAENVALAWRSPCLFC